MRHHPARPIGALLGLALTLPFATPALAGSPGTTIIGRTNLDATIDRTERYRWEVQKNTLPGQVPFVIARGESVDASFTIHVTRTGPEITEVQSPVIGEVCVSNQGDVATHGLTVRDQLEMQVGGVWTPVGPLINVAFGGNLAAHESRCVSFPIPGVTINPAYSYRNHGFATIDNYAGREGMPTTIQFYGPSNIVVNTHVIGATAHLTDIFECPENFTCTFASPIDLELSGSIEIPVTITLTNDNYECGQNLTLENIARLLVAGSREPIDAIATITVYTGSCENPDPGCVRTQGYWGSSPQGQALLAALVTTPMPLGTPTYTAPQLDSILDTAVGGNALLNLGHQLIAAKANILNGASSTPVASAITTADSLIGSLVIPPVGSGNVDPSSPLGQQMTDVATTLDQYNNGNLGIPHCEDDNNPRPRRGRGH